MLTIKPKQVLNKKMTKLYTSTLINW